MSMITWAQGNTRTKLPITCQSGVGATATAVDLTTQTAITLTMQRVVTGTPSLPWRTLTGVATVTAATAGQFTFAFAAADVMTPGVYNLVTTVTFSDTTQWVSLPAQFTLVETK